MRVSKIPGLGRFGIFIDDLDLTNMTDEQWFEIGRLHLENLVTIIRDVRFPLDLYNTRMDQWGRNRQSAEYLLLKKYSYPTTADLAKAVQSGQLTLDPADMLFVKTAFDIVTRDHRGDPTHIIKVTGKRDADGNPLGMFAEGELLWHSNESGTLTFTPGVALLGSEGMIGSATGFVTTTDYYESVSNSFRSELDDMMLVHKFTPGKINPGLRDDQDFLMYRNMCPVDHVKIPLVIRSPGGISGLHYSINTIHRIDGLSEAESQRIFDIINRDLFTDRYVYDHWYQRDNDLLLFDNSITLHRRLGGITNRLAYRIQHDYSNLITEPYQPYRQDEIAVLYNEQIADIVRVLQIPDFKLPQ